MSRHIQKLIICVLALFVFTNGDAKNMALPVPSLEIIPLEQTADVNDSLLLSDSVKVILSQVDSTMSDSLSNFVIETARPYIPGKDGYLFPDIHHFIEHPDVYNFGYIESSLTYKQQLRLIYDTWVTYDSKVNFNAYRYKPVLQGLILNYYALENITYHEIHFPDLWYPKQLLLDVDTFPYHLDYWYFNTTAQEASETWKKIRTEATISNPSQVDLLWEQLPDPPMISDTVYMPFMRNVELDYENFSGKEREYVRNITGFEQATNPWELKGYGALHANETFVKNWAKGGESSISLLGIGRFEADYNKKGIKWENQVELKLGALKQFGENEFLRKSDDRIKLSSKLGYRAFKKWYYTIDFDFQTQGFYGYDLKDVNNEDPISGFLSPAKTYLSIGLDYKYKKNLLSVLISPLTMKNTLVADTANINERSFGIEEGKRSKTEAGAYIKAALKWKINEEMHFNSNLYLFSNYVKNPQNIDVDWEGEYEYKFSHVFSLRLSLNLKYDDDEKILIGKTDEGEKIYSKRVQLKQLMSVGFSYRF